MAGRLVGALVDRIPGQARALVRRGIDRVLPRHERLVDRYLLEDVIFPTLAADPSVHELLFIGCDVYTRDYPPAKNLEN